MSGMRLRFLQCLLLAARMAVAIGSAGALFTDVVQAEPAHSPELVTVEGRRVEAVNGNPASASEFFAPLPPIAPYSQESAYLPSLRAMMMRCWNHLLNH